MHIPVNIHASWQHHLAPLFQFPGMVELNTKILPKCKFYPKAEHIFNVFRMPLNEVRVVILGQDPYHNENQANGLCFSVSDQVKTPPSLQNIYKELKEDLGIEKNSNELEDWAKQGVLLLNSTLTVKAHEPNSHKNLGWDTFTDFIIKEISDKKNEVVFVLWGAFAQKKVEFIDQQKHLVISAPHPSPFSAHKGFFGSKPFSQINEYLKLKNKEEIKW